MLYELLNIFIESTFLLFVKIKSSTKHGKFVIWMYI